MSATPSDFTGLGRGTILRRKSDGTFESITDEVTVEEPLEIRIGEKPLAITMRTPGNDEELAAGFLLTEGVIRNRADLKNIGLTNNNAPGRENMISLALKNGVETKTGALQRFGTISASCGLCGKTSIESIRSQFPPLRSTTSPRLNLEKLLQFPERLREAQMNFDRTGGIHAAAIFDLESDVVIVREDVGRHNAVDKAIGRALLDDQLPLSQHALMVSGRCSLEIVQKALAAGIAIVASVSAPSSLAINFARESGQTLIGFLRPPTFNVYAHVERLEL